MCTAKPVETNCGQDIGVVLASFIESLSPKFCLQTSNEAATVLNSLTIYWFSVGMQMIIVTLFGT